MQMEIEKDLPKVRLKDWHLGKLMRKATEMERQKGLLRGLQMETRWHLVIERGLRKGMPMAQQLMLLPPTSSLARFQENNLQNRHLLRRLLHPEEVII